MFSILASTLLLLGNLGTHTLFFGYLVFNSDIAIQVTFFGHLVFISAPRVTLVIWKPNIIISLFPQARPSNKVYTYHTKFYLLYYNFAV